MDFEWDSQKEKQNSIKHGISFKEAITVFEDPLFLIFSDPDHSLKEKRLILMGESKSHRLLVVSFTQRPGGVRIISARKATRKEKIFYEEEN